ncbi:MAG: hypothetical protein ABSA75_08580 [Candidatus Bathyarchaeia archaeon]
MIMQRSRSFGVTIEFEKAPDMNIEKAFQKVPEKTLHFKKQKQEGR